MKYEEIAKINVNEHTEKKNGLTYLSWAWAVDQLLRHDPSATWEYHEPQAFGQTLMVSCTVHAFGKSMRCHLPVIDHRNAPIANPNAFQVNTSMMRCLAKAIALHGLGLYIYAGEDLPMDETPVKSNGKPQPIPEGVSKEEKERNAKLYVSRTLYNGKLKDDPALAKEAKAWYLSLGDDWAEKLLRADQEGCETVAQVEEFLMGAVK